jgi:hypothetical protein
VPHAMLTDRVAFERMALAMTAEVCKELGLDFSLEELVQQLPTMQRSISRIELDASIRLRDERRTVIAIEVKKARSLRQVGFRLLANRIRGIEASVPSFGGLLLITDDVVDTSFVKNSIQFADKFRTVVVRDADDRRRLKDAITMMIRLASDAST